MGKSAIHAADHSTLRDQSLFEGNWYGNADRKSGLTGRVTRRNGHQAQPVPQCEAPATDIERLCARFACASAAERESMISELEACVPSTESTWRLVDALCRKLGLRVWVQIMVERFLQREPDNLAAQFARFDLLAENAPAAWQLDQRRQYLIDEAVALACHPAIDADGLVRLALALAVKTERRHAVTIFQQALRLDRTHAAAWNGLVNALTGMNKKHSAAAALRNMQKAIPPSVANYAMVADCARWVGDVKTIRRACEQALQLQQAAEPAAWVRLAQLLDQINAIELLPQAMAHIDVTSLHRPWMLRALMEVGRIRGFTDIVRTAEARLSAIEG